MENKEYKGYNGILVLTDRAVIIKRGKRGFLLGGGMLRGEKTIPYSAITSVQLKKAGALAGYIQISTMGGSEAKSGLLQSATDENTINFHTYKKGNELFAEAKEIIESRIGSQSNNSSLDELEKLASLKEKGVITQEEFDGKKKQILAS